MKSKSRTFSLQNRILSVVGSAFPPNSAITLFWRIYSKSINSRISRDWPSLASEIDRMPIIGMSARLLIVCFMPTFLHWNQCNRLCVRVLICNVSTVGVSASNINMPISHIPIYGQTEPNQIRSIIFTHFIGNCDKRFINLSRK